jgi:hypothetical protein
MLNILLGENFLSFGTSALQSLFRDGDLGNLTDEYFPKVSMCTLPIRILGNIHKYTLQCVLPINIFNEVIFLFLWFWLIFNSLINFISLTSWITFTSIKYFQIQFIKHKIPDETKTDITDFLNNYLGKDGVFILHLVNYNTSTVTSSEYMKKMFSVYNTGSQKIKDKSDV